MTFNINNNPRSLTGGHLPVLCSSKHFTDICIAQCCHLVNANMCQDRQFLLHFLALQRLQILIQI